MSVSSDIYKKNLMVHTVVFHILGHNTGTRECWREKKTKYEMGKFGLKMRFFLETYFQTNPILELEFEVKLSKCHFLPYK